MQSTLRPVRDLKFLLSIGLLLAFSLYSTILSTTIFETHYLQGFLGQLLLLPLFAFFLGRRWGIMAFIAAVLGFFAFAAYGFMGAPEHPGPAQELAGFLLGVLEFVVVGTDPFGSYANFILWLIKGFVALFVVIFTYVKFYFYPMAAMLALVLGLSITSPYFEPSWTVWALVASMVILLCRYLSGKLSGGGYSQVLTLFVAISLGIGSQLPKPVALFEGGNPAITRTPAEFFADAFHALVNGRGRLAEFSLQSIGFGGAGGLLGGDLLLNDHVFMRMRNEGTHGPVYLTGRVSDTYTGYSWENSYLEALPVDFSSGISQNLEILEVASSFQLLSLVTSLQGLETGRLMVATEGQLEATLFESFESVVREGWFQPEVLEGVALDDLDDEGVLHLWQSYFREEWMSHSRIALVDVETGFIEWEGVPYGSYWDFPTHPDMALGNMGRLTIDALQSRTASAFHTGVVTNIIPHRDFIPYMDFMRVPERELFMETRMPRDGSYTIIYFRRHQENDINGFMRPGFAPADSHQGIFEQAYTGIREFEALAGYNFSNVRFTVPGGNGPVTHPELISNYLIPRAQAIRERYTQLPDNFPDRVGELAATVVEGAENDYARMRLLETFLAEGFEYTTSPGATPRDQDFVDHFLFDLQRGYCVHFATAFVTMARSLGMPARYVEGFLVNERPAAGSQGFVDVRNNMAHAWGEVYFEGFGWQRFEPTPSGGLPYNYFAIEDIVAEEIEDAPASAGEGQSVASVPAMDGLDDAPVQQQPDAQIPPQEAEVPTQAATPAEVPGGSEGAQPTGIQIPLISVIAAFAFFPVLLIAAHSIQKRKRRKSTRFAVMDGYQAILSCLKAHSLIMDPGETTQQFMDRAKESVSFPGQLMASQAIYEKARYSRQKITREDANVLEQTAKSLRQSLKSEAGLLKNLYFAMGQIIRPLSSILSKRS
ncbi:MAG: DUF3488 and transglutaminase-like domain-containing protein [Turicibacter sp.]|nr:DUF3488 and transglutaminase-like domain-containing protein [Turicibacter sp.]